MFASFDRRDFLRRTAGLSTLLGFSYLVEAAADEPAPPKKPPTAEELLRPALLFAQARKRMQDETKPGVVLIIPADPNAARAMADGLARLLGAPAAVLKRECEPIRIKGVGLLEPIGAGDPAAQRVFCRAVFLCLPREEARKLIPDVPANASVLLLDTKAALTASLPGDASLYGKDFAARMATLLDGEKGERRTALAAAQWKALGEKESEKVDAALRDLDDRRFAVREKADTLLAQHAPRITAVLADAAAGPVTLERRRRLERLLEQLYARAPESEPGSRLPFGVKWDEVHVEPCPGCGLGFTPVGSRTFLRFLTDKPDPGKQP